MMSLFVYPCTQEFYAKVVIFAAKKSAQGFFSSYGYGMLAGIVGVIAVKGTLRSVPVVGLIASPFLGELFSSFSGDSSS